MYIGQKYYIGVTQSVYMSLTYPWPEHDKQRRLNHDDLVYEHSYSIMNVFDVDIVVVAVAAVVVVVVVDAFVLYDSSVLYDPFAWSRNR